MLSVLCKSLYPPRSTVNFKNGASMTRRMLSMERINGSLYLCTDKPRKIEVNTKSLRFTQVKENTKPIVLLLSWFLGKPNQINKYSKLYTDQGMDVLVAQLSLSQFLFSVRDVDGLGKQIADILQTNEDHYKEIYLHTFSAGGALWGVTQRIIQRDMNKYGNIPNRIIGQVWDSAAHNNQAIVAAPYAMFPTNAFLRLSLTAALKILFTVHRPLIRHYEDCIIRVFDNLIKSPALLLYSKVDPIGLVNHNVKLEAKWRDNGVHVTSKCFEKSGHVKHYQVYTEEYLKYLHNHWKLVKLLERK